MPPKLVDETSRLLFCTNAWTAAASSSSIGYLNLPPGKFAIFAKLYLAQGSGDLGARMLGDLLERLDALGQPAQ